MNLVRRDADRVFVANARDTTVLPQEEINRNPAAGSAKGGHAWWCG
ncbi:hypothetical protein ACLK19_22480 [Escherichia coli]